MQRAPISKHPSPLPGFGNKPTSARSLYASIISAAILRFRQFLYGFQDGDTWKKITKANAPIKDVVTNFIQVPAKLQPHVPQVSPSASKLRFACVYSGTD